MAQTEISADVISLRYLKLLVAELGFHRVAQAGPHCLGLSSAGVTGFIMILLIAAHKDKSAECVHAGCERTIEIRVCFTFTTPKESETTQSYWYLFTYLFLLLGLALLLYINMNFLPCHLSPKP